jgi:hypothetical protein
MMAIHAHLVMNGNLTLWKKNIVLEQLRQTSHHAVEALAALVLVIHPSLTQVAMILDVGLRAA